MKQLIQRAFTDLIDWNTVILSFPQYNSPLSVQNDQNTYGIKIQPFSFLSNKRVLRTANILRVIYPFRSEQIAYV